MVALVVTALAGLLAGCSGDDEAPAARMGTSGSPSGVTSGVTDTIAPPTSAASTTAPLDPELEDIIAGAGMTDLGRRLFLSADPSVEDPATLATSCTDVDATAGPDGAHTFGCLIDGQIHLRSFAEPQVADLVYVVAAHELLHVVYGRMTRAQRLAIDPELAAARDGNAILEERLEVYAAVDEDTPNEIHSLLGTEFADLSPVLEEHYGEYFDRDRVLSVFRRTLGDREDEIRGLKASITEMEAQLDAIQAELDAQDASGDLAGYNANVSRFNALVAVHNADVRRVNELVDEDNRLTGN
ncbi:MAG: hypothetical protein QOE93_2453 [Actinomycetota bacterium]|jgi:hypothetical protein|nr:hypothetical protein [Actinomycetota bacterium]